ncbi:FkbM family methyltransferase [Rhodopirellula baltica]|nr:FkbM family methyltransferase [Rhodopirellula baltica]
MLQKLLGVRPGPVRRILPWGYPVWVEPQDYIGHRVLRHGLTALEACETSFRLLDPGDVAADVGANYGVVTAAMVAAVGKTGTVTAVEMHPKTFAALQRNVNEWDTGGTTVRLIQAAASDRSGEIIACESEDYASNSGVGYVTHQVHHENHRQRKVSSDRLDHLLNGKAPVFLKLDVERHELEALRGAGELISNHSVPHLLVEDLVGRTPVKDLLQDAGYTLFELECDLRGPKVCPVNFERPFQDGVCSDILATKNPDEVRRRFESPGYRCLN